MSPGEAREAALEIERRRLHDIEADEDRAFGCAQRTPHPNLHRALADRDEQHVGHAHRAHEQPDTANQTHEQFQARDDLREHFQPFDGVTEEVAAVGLVPQRAAPVEDDLGVRNRRLVCAGLFQAKPRRVGRVIAGERRGAGLERNVERPVTAKPPVGIGVAHPGQDADDVERPIAEVDALAERIAAWLRRS